MKSPIIITGCARSGTSLVAGVVNLCGAFGGIMAGANSNNEKGMFENVQIRQAIVKPYLRGMGVDPLGQYPLPKIPKLQIPLDWKSRVEKVMVDQGLKDGSSWFYKGAKCCLVWPIWHYAFPNAKWIIVRRRTGDIVNSCMKTSFMRAFSNPAVQKKVNASNEREGWVWWVRWHEQRFVEMIQAGLNVKVVWPERMVLHDYEQMMETIQWLGLKWDDKVLSFVTPKLWNSRKKIIGK